MNQPFWKGHGTGNDFVIIEDLHDYQSPTKQQVQAWCDRHFGIGADGLLRVVQGEDGVFFMDYRNADGSIAEMCGNGLRVFARHLLERGLVDKGNFEVATRAGRRQVQVLGEDIQVSMGPARVGQQTWIELAGKRYTAKAVDVGNPHAVVQLESKAELDSLTLRAQPAFDVQLFPTGVNVEFCHAEPDSVLMRVHERGVGETLSCGTGVVASAAVHLQLLAAETDEFDPTRQDVRVTVPGGALQVTFDAQQAWLSGPAVIIARGELCALDG
mgnify:CR=1 FL=1